jgi:phage terminase large subunit
LSKPIKIEIPEAFSGLFEPKRFKTYYGGRGGAKSHNIARALLVMGMQSPKRFLCARELQGSIGDSVHKLLSDIISDHKLNTFYDVQKATIKGKNGTEFIFKGLKHNATEIKSTEGIDIAWIEEAEKVSQNSWEILIPTIRKAGSEIWISFNPKHPTDPTYINFVENADDDMLVKKVSWRDNPFFPDTLNTERLRLQKTDTKAYNHIWEGEFDERHFGGIYATYVNQARDDDRVTLVPHKDGVPVITAWDLGNSDATVIWFAQVVGFQTRIIDYYANSQKDLAHYAQVIRSKDYEYKAHYLPHDAGHERLGMGGSISQQLKVLGIPNKIIKVGSVAGRIELARDLLKTCYIDRDTCKDGLHALINYQFEWDDNKQMFKTKPLHDWASDPADAFGYLAQALEMDGRATKPVPADNYVHQSGASWMG